ncbi:MAG: hypothetical protein ABIH00_08150 [Armatimonadota bacterium]
MYNNLKNNRYRSIREDNLWVNLNNIEPDHHDKKARRFKEIVLYLHKYTMPDNVVVFPYLNNTAYKDWPKNERIRFITFCRENMTESQYMAFTRQARDTKVDLPAWAQVEIWWAELNFMNPSKLLAEINKNAKMGPLLSDKEAMASFMGKYRKEIAEGKLKQIYVYMDGKDSKGVLIPRIALIPNNFKSAAYFTMLKGRHLVYKTIHDKLPPEAIDRYCAKIDEWNFIEKGFSYVDMAVIPALAKINNETGRWALLEMYGVFMCFRQFYNPISITRFIVGLSRIDKDVAEAVHVWNHGTDTERALLIGSLMGLIFGPKAFGKVNKFAVDNFAAFKMRRIRNGATHYTIVKNPVDGKVYSISPDKNTGFVSIIREDGVAWAAKKQGGRSITAVQYKAPKGQAPKGYTPKPQPAKGGVPVPAYARGEAGPILDPSVFDAVASGKVKLSEALAKVARKDNTVKMPKPSAKPDTASPTGIVEAMQEAAGKFFTQDSLAFGTAAAAASGTASAAGGLKRPVSATTMAMSGEGGKSGGNIDADLSFIDNDTLIPKKKKKDLKKLLASESKATDAKLKEVNKLLALIYNTKINDAGGVKDLQELYIKLRDMIKELSPSEKAIDDMIFGPVPEESRLALRQKLAELPADLLGKVRDKGILITVDGKADPLVYTEPLNLISIKDAGMSPEDITSNIKEKVFGEKAPQTRRDLALQQIESYYRDKVLPAIEDYLSIENNRRKTERCYPGRTELLEPYEAELREKEAEIKKYLAEIRQLSSQSRDISAVTSQKEKLIDDICIIISSGISRTQIGQILSVLPEYVLARVREIGFAMIFDNRTGFIEGAATFPKLNLIAVKAVEKEFYYHEIFHVLQRDNNTLSVMGSDYVEMTALVKEKLESIGNFADFRSVDNSNISEFLKIIIKTAVGEELKLGRSVTSDKICNEVTAHLFAAFYADKINDGGQVIYMREMFRNEELRMFNLMDNIAGNLAKGKSSERIVLKSKLVQGSSAKPVFPVDEQVGSVPKKDLELSGVEETKESRLIQPEDIPSELREVYSLLETKKAEVLEKIKDPNLSSEQKKDLVHQAMQEVYDKKIQPLLDKFEKVFEESYGKDKLSEKILGEMEAKIGQEELEKMSREDIDRMAYKEMENVGSKINSLTELIQGKMTPLIRLLQKYYKDLIDEVPGQKLSSAEKSVDEIILGNVSGQERKVVMEAMAKLPSAVIENLKNSGLSVTVNNSMNKREGFYHHKPNLIELKISEKEIGLEFGFYHEIFHAIVKHRDRFPHIDSICNRITGYLEKVNSGKVRISEFLKYTLSELKGTHIGNTDGEVIATLFAIYNIPKTRTLLQNQEPVLYRLFKQLNEELAESKIFPPEIGSGPKRRAWKNPDGEIVPDPLFDGARGRGRVNPAAEDKSVEKTEGAGKASVVETEQAVEVFDNLSFFTQEEARAIKIIFSIHDDELKMLKGIGSQLGVSEEEACNIIKGFAKKVRDDYCKNNRIITQQAYDEYKRITNNRGGISLWNMMLALEEQVEIIKGIKGFRKVPKLMAEILSAKELTAQELEHIFFLIVMSQRCNDIGVIGILDFVQGKLPGNFDNAVDVHNYIYPDDAIDLSSFPPSVRERALDFFDFKNLENFIRTKGIYSPYAGSGETESFTGAEMYKDAKRREHNKVAKFCDEKFGEEFVEACRSDNRLKRRQALDNMQNHYLKETGNHPALFLNKKTRIINEMIAGNVPYNKRVELLKFLKKFPSRALKTLYEEGLIICMLEGFSFDRQLELRKILMGEDVGVYFSDKIMLLSSSVDPRYALKNPTLYFYAAMHENSSKMLMDKTTYHEFCHAILDSNRLCKLLSPEFNAVKDFLQKHPEMYKRYIDRNLAFSQIDGRSPGRFRGLPSIEGFLHEFFAETFDGFLRDYDSKKPLEGQKIKLNVYGKEYKDRLQELYKIYKKMYEKLSEGEDTNWNIIIPENGIPQPIGTQEHAALPEQPSLPPRLVGPTNPAPSAGSNLPPSSRMRDIGNGMFTQNRIDGDTPGSRKHFPGNASPSGLPQKHP